MKIENLRYAQCSIDISDIHLFLWDVIENEQEFHINEKRIVKYVMSQSISVLPPIVLRPPCSRRTMTSSTGSLSIGLNSRTASSLDDAMLFSCFYHLKKNLSPWSWSSYKDKNVERIIIILQIGQCFFIINLFIGHPKCS